VTLSILTVFCEAADNIQRQSELRVRSESKARNYFLHSDYYSIFD